MLNICFQDDYVEISNQCQQLAVDLLEECRTSEEVSLLLKQTHDPKVQGVTNTTKYPRLTLAVTYHQKRVGNLYLKY